MQVNPKRMTAMGRSVRAFVQNWLNRETDKSIVLVRWGDLLLVRFGVVSSIALLLGLISFIIVFRGIGIGRAAMHNLLVVSPLSLILFSFIQGLLFSHSKGNARFQNISFGFFGGIAGVVCTFSLAAMHYKINLLLMLDASVLLSAFIHGYARIACINYGCCHGRERLTGGNELHIVYKHSESKAVRVSGLGNRPLYPVQLYEIVGCFAIGFVLLGMAAFWHRTGLLLGTYLVLYGGLRFICEFYRGEKETPKIIGLTAYQWICATLIPLGVACVTFAIVRGIPETISLNRTSLVEPFAYMPFLISMPFVILFFYGFHYRTVGKWR